MRYKLYSPDGLEIGFITDDPEFRWEVDKSFQFRKELERHIQQSRNYQMVMAGGEMADNDVTPPEERVTIDDTGRVIRLASELPGSVPVQVERADEMDKGHIAESLVQRVDKARRYVESPEDAPEDAEVQEGPQGGFYYETDSTTPEGDPTPSPHDFTPAESKEEAVQFAKENIAEEVDMDGMGLQAMNEVNEALYEFVQMDSLPGLEEIDYQPGGANVSGATASQAGDSIYLSGAFEDAEKYNVAVEELTEGFGNQKLESVQGDIEYLQNNIEEMERRAEDEEDPDRRERMLQNAENYREQLEERQEQVQELRESKADRPSATATLGDVIRHEYAHHLAKEFSVTDITGSMIMKGVFRGDTGIGATFKPHGKKKARAVSKYAASQPGEYVAESFVAYQRGEHDRLEDKVIEFWDTMLEKGPQGDWSEEYERWA